MEVKEVNGALAVIDASDGQALSAGLAQCLDSLIGGTLADALEFTSA